MLRWSVLTAVLVAGAVCGPAAAWADPAPSTQIIVKRAPGLTAAERADVRSDAGVSYASPVHGLDDVEVVDARPGDRASALADLRSDPDVLWAEPNATVRADTTDASWGQLWGLHNAGQSVLGVSGIAGADIDVESAWQITKGSGATVAVVDSGVKSTHGDLAGALVAGHDFVDDDSTPQDANGHGTHVTGTIAARENTTGVVGVAPQVSIMPVRVLDASGSGSNADVAAGFDWAAENGARIVNASLGGSSPSQAVIDAIADHPDTLFVVAAGNDGVDDDVTPHYPCNYNLDNVLCVGATDQSDQQASFSNWGATSVDIHAPGVGILSTFPSELPCGGSTGYDFCYMNGTSMATPHVAGVAALLLANDPTLTALEVKAAILAGGDPVAALTGDSVTGMRLDALGALEASGTQLPPDTTAPATPAGVTATGGDRRATVRWTRVADADLASYRLYMVGTAQPIATISKLATQASIQGLAAGTSYGFRVSAVDASGNESPPSATVVAATDAAPATPAASDIASAAEDPLADLWSPGDDEPAADEPALPRLSGATITGRVVTCATGARRCSASTARLMLQLDVAATVRIALARRTCKRGRCTWGRATSKSVRLKKGRNTLTIGRTLAGIKVPEGTLRVTVTGVARTRTLTVKVVRRTA